MKFVLWPLRRSIRAPPFSSAFFVYNELMEKSSRASSILLPLSIIIAGVFIAGAVIYVKKSDPGDQLAASLAATHDVDVNISPVTDGDHVMGNPNAPVVLLE